MVTKFGMGDEVRDPYPYAKFHYDLSHPASLHGGPYKVTRLVFLQHIRIASAVIVRGILSVHPSIMFQ